MTPALLDTDILSEVLKQRDPRVVAQAATYLEMHGQFAFSALTRYEIVRGLRDRDAAAQLRRFEEFCQHSVVLPINDEVLLRAADLWVFARRQGRSRSDADLIIAATAVQHGRTLVTGNTAHFNGIPDLDLEDWRT
jgi:tRNA(fMet)-specific endonuclease VapC